MVVFEAKSSLVILMMRIAKYKNSTMSKHENNVVLWLYNGQILFVDVVKDACLVWCIWIDKVKSWWVEWIEHRICGY